MFALSATVLSGVGLFAMVARGIATRRRELGIRVALGAHRGTLIRSMLMAETRVLLLGVLLGLAGATAAGRIVSRFLFRVSPFDPVAMVGAALLLLATGITACWAAARRGTALDPATAIRLE